MVFTNLAEGTGTGTMTYSTTVCPSCSLKQPSRAWGTVQYIAAVAKIWKWRKMATRARKWPCTLQEQHHRGLDGPSWNVVLLLRAEFHELEPDPRLIKRGPKVAVVLLRLCCFAINREAMYSSLQTYITMCVSGMWDPVMFGTVEAILQDIMFWQAIHFGGLSSRITRP
jgi:hypothetical protein